VPDVEAILVDVANGLKTAIAAHDFGLEFDSEVNYADATRTLQELNGKLYVDFSPFRSPTSFDARGVIQYTCTVDTIIRQKFAVADLNIQKNGRIDVTAINRLLKFEQDIEEYILASVRSLTLSSTSWTAALKSTDKKLDYSRPHLYTNQQFTGWIRATYLASKEI
jgi:hypothetical protein